MKIKILLFLAMLSLVGCSTMETRYVNYSEQKFTPKPHDYFVSVYNSKTLSVAQSFTVIGKVNISGHASEGVTQDNLMEQAKAVARKKGADAIINARVTIAPYNRVEVVPGYVSYHRRWARYHPTEYVPYSDTLLTLQGELVVFNPVK